MVVDDDGKGLFSTGLRHGDALHVGDLDPARPGLEVFGIHENEEATVALGTPGLALYDARTGEIIWSLLPGGDVGRGLAADIDPRHPGYEFWTSAPAGLLDVRGREFPTRRAPSNFAVWWDADPLREILDGNWIGKWDPATASLVRAADGRRRGVEQRHEGDAGALGRHLRRLARRSHLAIGGQHVAADLHDDDPGREPPGHADARSHVPARDRLAERRLQPAAASGIFPRPRHEASRAPAHRRTCAALIRNGGQARC